MIAATVLGATLLCASPASAQCYIDPDSQDYSSPGEANLRAQTWFLNCGVDHEALVVARIYSASYACAMGTMSGGGCLNTSSGGVSTQSVAYSQSVRCGEWTGLSDHGYRTSPGAWSMIQMDRITVLHAGICYETQEECEYNGYTWVGDYCDLISPIIIATGKRQDYKLTSPRDGVSFDLDGDGTAEFVAWTEPNAEVAFLAIDRDGDGAITSGKELFGNVTVNGQPNGFEALRVLSQSTIGLVNSDVPFFSKLLLWTDRNHNGISEASELTPASELLSDIGFGYTPLSRRDGNGNEYRFQGFAHIRTAPGANLARESEEKQRRLNIYDVFLKVER